MAEARKSTRSAQMLAGKHAERVVMRNGSDANPFRRVQNSGDISVMEPSNRSSSESPLTLVETRALAQRRQALEKAHLARDQRATTRRRMKEGQLDWDTFLDETPASCLKVRIVDALQWLPYIGTERAQRLLTGVPDVRLDTLVRELSCKAKYALSHRVTLFYGSHTKCRRSRAA